LQDSLADITSRRRNDRGRELCATAVTAKDWELHATSFELLSKLRFGPKLASTVKGRQYVCAEKRQNLLS